MILIAESGASKIEWRTIQNKNEIVELSTEGFNPYVQSVEVLKKIIETNKIGHHQGGEIKKVFFYGAGCSSDRNKEIVKGAIQFFFQGASIEVAHDLMGATRAACGNERGIVCILGTGSNSCLYDGKNIIDRIPSLGYILGDEGSGVAMGKILLNKIIRKQLPQEVLHLFHSTYPLNEEILLQNVYKEPYPSKYIASYTKFLSTHRAIPELYQIVSGSIRAFFDSILLHYPHYQTIPVFFVGSIAFYFSDILHKIASEKNISIQNIIQSPIQNLVLYHIKDIA
ncbi:MAG: hypothetical protein QM536_09745 [Chitinophagaceae bacterium]|nr:hypothetical protein [Chitinophagaceae bacterium]